MNTAPRATLLLPVLPANARFGSAQPEFWQHCAMGLAWPDGQGEGHRAQRA